MNRVSFHAVASVDMAIAKFFKPCWLMKKKPINHMHSEEEVGILHFFFKKSTNISSRSTGCVRQLLLWGNL